MENAVVCGQSISESLASYDQSTSSWKTSQHCLEGELIEFSGTWPASGMVRNGKLYMRPTLGCLIVENESSLLPTPTRSFGVNARGWGLSQTGRLRYSQQMQDNALRFTYRPPIALLEWMMGFPENHTAIELAASGMPLSLQQRSGSENKSLTTISDFVETSETGLTFKEGLSYGDWESIGFDLAKVGKAMQWWIGDWVNYGGKRYGETYKAAIDATGMKLGTVMTMASVCRAFETSRRREVLSFGHHVEVWSLEPDKQDELLDRAEVEGLSCAKLREAVRALKGLKFKVVAKASLPEDCGFEDETSRSKADGCSNEDAEDYDYPVIKAFQHCDYRLNTLNRIIKMLEPSELDILKSWLQ